jgi:hypothetical protein
VETVTPILAQETLADGKYGITVCSWNNQPVSLIDPRVLTEPYAPFVIAHEMKHAADMRANKGGCWPFLHRYNADSAFMRAAEFRAYCAEGQLAISQNRNPLEVWLRIKKEMLFYGLVLADSDNCLFTSWPDIDPSKAIPPFHTPDTVRPPPTLSE